jgi:ubiquinone biosynthesis protein COQ4
VLLFLQAVNIGSLKGRVRELEVLPDAEALLRDQPRIDARSIDYGALERLPDGTLGREYVRFLQSNKITPEAFERPPQLGDPRLSYLVTRLRQTHDLWHVVTGYPADVRGELLLQAFTYAQLRTPGSALIALLGSLRFGWKFRHHARAMWRAYRRGKEARAFAAFAWERHFEVPGVEVRQLLHCGD